MSIPEFDQDRHLRALFGGLDTKRNFDARLMARLRVETQIEATGRAAIARERERARYRREVLGLRTSRRLMLRLLTLDALGIAALLVIAIGAAWRLFGADVMGTSREYGAHILIAFSILIASVPLSVMWAEQSRKSIRLL
jgi:hypothetical protein